MSPLVNFCLVGLRLVLSIIALSHSLQWRRGNGFQLSMHLRQIVSKPTQAVKFNLFLLTRKSYPTYIDLAVVRDAQTTKCKYNNTYLW